MRFFYALNMFCTLIIVTGCNLGFNDNDNGNNNGRIEVNNRNFGTRFTSVSTTFDIELQNTGNVVLEDFTMSSGVYFSIDGGVFPGSMGNCGFSIKPGETCTVTMKVDTPSMEGPLSEMLTLGYRWQGRSFWVTDLVDFSGDVQDNGALSVVSPLNFGKVNVGTSKTMSLNLKNSSTVDNISSITYRLPSGPFKILGFWPCSYIGRGLDCNVDIEMTPTMAGVITKQLDISYVINGKVKYEQIDITGDGDSNSNDSLEVADTGRNAVSVVNGGSYQVTLEVEHNVPGGNTASRIDVDSGLPPGFTKDARTSCSLSTSLSYSQKCKIILNSPSYTMWSPLTSHVGSLTFTSNGRNINHAYTFSRSVSIIAPPKNSVDLTDLMSGTYEFAAAQPVYLSMKIANNTLDTLSDFDVTGLAAVGMTLDKGISTCPVSGVIGAISLQTNESCRLVFWYTPSVIGPFSTGKNLVLKYERSGTTISTPFKLKADFVKPAIANLGTVLKVKSHNFGTKTVKIGDDFPVSMTVKNSSTTPVTIINVKRDSGVAWDSFLAWDQAAGNCQINTVLAAGASCPLVVRLKPNPLKKASIKEKLRVDFKEAGKATTVSDTFFMQGNWTILSRPITSAAQTDPPIIIKATNFANDRYTAFHRRPPENTVVARGYPQWMFNAISDPFKLNLTTNLAGSKLQHLPLSFRNTARIYKIKDVIADRIVENGKRYVKFYHGTDTSTSVFSSGVNSINFSKGGGFLGTGFYMTASLNEALAYSCRNINAGTAGSGKTARVLVVGIEENDFVTGRDIASGTGPYMSDANGRGTNLDVHFLRNGDNGWKAYNQFVFFSENLPYMKLFEIVELPDNFNLYFSPGVPNEDNGTSENDPVKAPIGKCKY